MATTLISRVRGHCTGQRTSGQSTLSLTGECIDHMFGESGDWTPLAYLIGKSEPAQSTMVRKAVGKIVQGWKISKDKEQPSGLRLSKAKGKNQGIDDTQRRKLQTFVEAKKSIQSNDVKEWLKPEAAATKTWAEDNDKAHQAARALAKRITENGMDISAFLILVKEEAKKLAEG